MKFIRLGLLPIFSLGACSLAHAHAFLDHADPRVGSSGPAPGQVTLWMTEDLEPIFTQVQVFDAQHQEVDKKDTKVSGSTIVISVPKLSRGTYLVKWKAVAIDTHHTSGTFKFTVQ